MSAGTKPQLAILGTRGIPARYGGFETFAEELSVRLVELGIEVTVFCAEPAPDGGSSFRGVNIACVPNTELGPLTTILFDVRSLWRARKGFDVVYMLGYGAAPFCILPRLWDTRVWLNVDGIEWARTKWGAIARAYFKLMEAASLWAPNLVIADATAIASHLRARHRKRKEIAVIAYGAPVISSPPEASLLGEWDLKPDSYYLIVCRLEPENHVLEMIDGFTRARTARALVVLGNHVSGTSYVAKLREFKDPRVRFLGTVYDQRKLQALRYHAYGYCHGHSVGGTNPSLLEALGCGNAVIAHDNVFNREVARDAAVYFGSAAQFTNCVDSLDVEDPRRQLMKRHAIDIITSAYTWDGIAKRYAELLRSETAERHA